MERCFFKAGAIEVTTSIIRFGDTAYPVANVGAVSIKAAPTGTQGLVGLIFVGAIVSFFFVEANKAWIALFFAFGLSGLAGKGETVLSIRTSSGDQRLYSDSNDKFVRLIKEAIEAAVASRN